MDIICTNLRAWGLHFAAHGWHVFPITPGAKNRPVIDRWEIRASTDPDQIHRWWRHLPYTIGIANGRSRLVVVDLDPANTQPAPDRWTTLGVSTGTGVLCTLARQQHTTVTPTYAVTTRVAPVLHRHRRDEESGGWGSVGPRQVQNQRDERTNVEMSPGGCG